jgi:GAF domain-containing protein
MASEDPIAEGMAALAKFFVGQGTLGDTLTQVSDLVCVSLSADMAGITMLADGKPSTAVFTDPASPEIDAEQYRTGHGPCLEAWRTQTIIRVDDTSSDRRWPAFCAVAAERGFRSTLSLPLINADEPLGALNLYSGQLDNFVAHDPDRAELWAAAAATVLANATAYHDSRELNENLREALTSRATIDRAVGIVMSGGGRSPADAYQILVRASQRENRKLREIATGIVEAAMNRRATRPPDQT